MQAVMPLPGFVPPAFDAGYYRAFYPELGLADDAAAAAHYYAAGRAEGRVASPLATREGLIDFLAGDRDILEIGPFCRPLLAGPRVDYLDVLDAGALRERALRLGLDPAGCPERIAFVGGLEQVDRRYDAVVSSHAIEHQPDLVAHLAAIERILRPGGFFALIVPDKRFCFDHFLPESSIAAVLQAHAERRTVHSLASVVEHGALVTHNDAARHWRGDHGEAGGAGGAERVRRIRAALERHERSAGDYVDVHAWQFTPDSFRGLVETLGDLGLARLEPIAVYDCPRDRMEFCALLQLRRPARPRPNQDHGMDILFLQTADPFRYYDMLRATAPTAIEYCRRHGLRYEQYVGIRRGWWHWQATYNRIPMLADLAARGFAGWAIYLDADAYINDLDFDLPAYLAAHADRPAIFATSGVTGERWDVNAGVAMINLGHPEGRRLVNLWAAAFAAIPDAELKAAERWRHGDNDQDLLQAILRDDAALNAGVHVESMDVINSRHARFIRQHLRIQTADLTERVQSIAADVHAVFAADALRAASASGEAVLDERGRASLFHPVRATPRLVAAPAASPRPDLAGRAIAAFAAALDPGSPPPYRRDFAAALARGDVATVATEMASFGSAAAAQGLLGGARQHYRATHDPIFVYRRAQRSYDALLSLAELCGTLPLENPDLGGWAENSRIPAAELAKRIGAALRLDLDPPPQLGAYLGIAAGGARILHLRMIEAIHTAWRAGQLVAGSPGRVVEIGGGIGLLAFYGRRLGIAGHAIVDAAVPRAIQAFVLGDLPGAPVELIAPPGLAAAAAAADLLVVEDDFFEAAPADCEAALQRVGRAGPARILAISQEGRGAGAPERPTMRALVAAAGGYRLAARQRHALRPGYVEEIYERR